MHLAIADPERALVIGAFDELLAIPSDLGPDERLHPVHPGRAELQRQAHAVLGPSPPADPVAGFENLDGHTGGLQRPSGNATSAAWPADGNLHRQIYLT